MVTRETVLNGSRLPHMRAITVLLIALTLVVAVVVIGIQAGENAPLTNQSSTGPATAVVPRDLDGFSRSEDYGLRHVARASILDYRDDYGTRHLGG